MISGGKDVMKNILSAEDLLWQWIRFGWNYRQLGSLSAKDQDWHGERIKMVMDMILGKGLADFMLFTSDTIRWAKDIRLTIVPGLVSTASSDVAYITRI